MTLPSLVHLLVAYGICFGLMNKVEFLRRVSVLDRLLDCAYCTGFHCGWVTWLAMAVAGRQMPEEGWANLLGVLVWGFASAAFCYIVDATVQWFEPTGE